MTISIKIHNINTTSLDPTCVVTIKDGENVVVDNANIGLQLNPDGTANTTWIQKVAKTKVLEYRTLGNSIITVDTGEG